MVGTLSSLAPWLMPDTPAQVVSIIVPMLNESVMLPDLLIHLAPFHQRGCEVILVDGGSEDNSIDLASAQGFIVIRSDRGRARQMNAGAKAANGDILLFLHADTRLPDQADRLVVNALRERNAVWGRFDVRITGKSRWLNLIASLMNQRSRLSGIATGDQAMFASHVAFEAADGFPDQPLMEDIELSKRLGRISGPVCLREKVITSGRRWEEHGLWRTVLLMWRLRLAYAFGVPVERLAREYR